MQGAREVALRALADHRTQRRCCTCLVYRLPDPLLTASRAFEMAVAYLLVDIASRVFLLNASLGVLFFSVRSLVFFMCALERSLPPLREVHPPRTPSTARFAPPRNPHLPLLTARVSPLPVRTFT